jgi:CO/xanthine dehydrogenase Mo-binding subunit
VFRGIAQHESFGTYVAHVVELSIQGGAVKVHRVVSAVDCGFVLNPDMIEAQVQGAVIFGLSAALKLEITLKDGIVQQSRFDQCDPLRMFECPKIEVHIIPSDESPMGIGEPGVPPVAPAICNAIFAATGRRIRSLPIRL